MNGTNKLSASRIKRDGGE